MQEYLHTKLKIQNCPNIKDSAVELFNRKSSSSQGERTLKR